jgi:hypothetical protein
MNKVFTKMSKSVKKPTSRHSLKSVFADRKQEVPYSIPLQYAKYRHLGNRAKLDLL